PHIPIATQKVRLHGLIGGQAHRNGQRVCGGGTVASEGQYVATRGPVGLVGEHSLVRLERCQIGECCVWTIKLSACDGAVEDDDRRAREREQMIVQGDYCRPVGNTAQTASDMSGLNRCLDLIAAARARGVRLMKEMLGTCDHCAVPEIRVLSFERHISAG